VAVAPSRQAAQDWFTHGHFKNLPALVEDPQVSRAVAAFIDSCTQANGEVLLPSGAHVLDFHATRQPRPPAGGTR
jgi:hypothetical protein